jgi:O-antigen ligase
MRAVSLGSPNPRIPGFAAEGALLLLWGFTAPIALIAPKALQIWVWLIPLASLAVISRHGLGVRLVAWRTIYAVMAVPLLALAIAAISVNPVESVLRALRLFGEFTALCLMVLSTLVLPEDLRLRLVRAAIIGVALAGAIILLDLAMHGALLTPLWGSAVSWEWHKVTYNRGVTVLAMLLPLCGAMFLAGLGRAQHKVLPFAALALGVAAVLAGVSNSAKVAMIIGLIVLALTYAVPAMLRLLLWGGAIAVFAMPWALDALPPRPLIEKTSASLQSIVHRTMIWEFTIERIKERPLFGWGLDASRRMPGGDTKLTVTGLNKAGAPGAGPVEMSGQVMPLHPHNAALQIWLELGGVGAAIVAGLIALAAEALAKMQLSRAAAAAVAGSFAAGLVVAFVSYGIWQGWWLSALFLIAATPALVRSKAQGEDPSNSGFGANLQPPRASSPA